MSVTRRDITIKADDGYELAATLHEPQSEPQSGPQSGSQSGPAIAPITIVASATGVPQSFYNRVAHFLAEHGRPTLTFDGRGIAKSAPPSLKGFPGRFRDWGILDFPGVIDWAGTNYPGRQLHWIGHSYGGFGLGLARNNAAVGKLLGVATMSADVRLIDHKLAGAQIGLFLFGLGPLAAHVLGYAPGRLSGGTDLPKQVVLEWSKWCRTPGFLFGIHDLPQRRYFETLTASVRLARMTDDSWVSQRGVEHLLGHFTLAKERSIWTIDPADAGGKPIGHLGLFRSEFRDTLWRDVLKWLER